MNKKADLSINTVIIAVIALLVLIVLAFIFSGRLTLFSSGAAECKGKCVTSGEKDNWGSGPCYPITSSNVKPTQGGTCVKDTGYCCINITA